MVPPFFLDVNFTVSALSSARKYHSLSIRTISGECKSSGHVYNNVGLSVCLSVSLSA